MTSVRIQTQRELRTGRYPTGWRSAARWFAFLLCAAYAGLFLAKIPSYYVYLRDSCLQSSCELAVLTPLPADVAAGWGLSNGGYAALYTCIALFDFAVYFAVALLVLRKRPNEPMSWIAATAMISFHSASFIVIQWPGLPWLTNLLEELSSLSFMLFLLLFPNGRIVVRPMFWGAIGLVVIRNASWYVPDPWGAAHWPIWLTLLWMTLLYGTIVWNQLIRYRRYAEVTEKQQTKWVLYGLLMAIAAMFIVSILPLIRDIDFYQSPDPAVLFVLDVAVMLVMLPIPITLGISMLRRRLWDIDPLVNRTLVYGCLSAIIIALYSVTVWYLSVLFRSGPNMIFSIMGAALVAFAFAPLKERLQRVANRMIYGAHNDPFSVLEKLGNRLKEPSSPAAVLEIVVRTVKDSLRLPYAAIHLMRGGEPLGAVSVGEEQGDAIAIPLIAGGEEIGRLLVCARAPEESFSDADWKLLRLLARQAGTVAQGVKQATEIERLLGDLQDTREQLVFAREEERRSMRKNLHDDIAPRLAAMRLTSSLVVDWIQKDPNRAIDIMNKFKQDIGDTVDEIRGIVYDLRPQALDELGLNGAIRQRVEQIGQINQVRDIAASNPPLQVELALPDQLPILPAAIEVGAYRIVTEAFLNVVKHARASRCLIRMTLREKEGAMMIEVTDNGIGFERNPVPTEGGLGLYSLRERAEELGGSCSIREVAGGGTQVVAQLPLRTTLRGGRY
ncbi:GAF domain-containing sensor histidine kinase [Paenibacillus xanthanilyticus]|uniref:histidine kinase n=1 Tax=Paenibacillus xanthanilyticus TaxID=1783531 RepID=A0ABV8K1M4_9BACL